MSKDNNHCHYSGLPSPMAYTDKTSNNKLTFEEWYDENEEKIWIELAETGADREMDFNSEVEFELRYNRYLDEYDDGGN